MINNKLFKIYRNISYDTLSKIPLVTGISYGGLIGSSIYIIKENPEIGLGMNLASSIAVYASYLCHKTNGKIYCKEISELRKLYNTVLENYRLVNEIFELTTPVEIYTMFNKVLENGYLSVNKEFSYEESTIKNHETLYPIIPITGHAVCRHIAPMLRDILRKNDIESNVMIVKMCPNTTKKIEKEIRQQLETIYDDEQEKIIEEIIKYYVELEKINTSPEKETTKLHAITLAQYDNKVHYLDSTQERIYKNNPKNSAFIMDKTSDDIEINMDASIFIGTKKDFENQKKQIHMENTEYEQDNKYVKETEKKFKYNKDVFEKLYINNKEIYEEINQKILRFKGR